MKRLFSLAGAGLLASAVFAGPVAAADFPSKPITFIVPYSAGGSSDTLVRGMQPYLEKAMNGTIVPKNVTGGGGAVGITQAAISSKADGYTVTLPSNAIFGLQGLGNVPWEYTDFDTFARVITEDYTVTARADAPFDSFQEFVDYVQANPGEVKIGFSGFGSSTHIVGAALAERFGLDMQMVPYKGGAKTVAATMGGHIDVNTHHPAEVKSGVDAGKLKVLAVLGPERSSLLPDAPTLKEMGHDYVVQQWRGIAAPNGVPDDVLAVWKDAVREMAGSAEFRTFVEERMGGTVSVAFDEELDAFLETMAGVFIPTAQKLKANQ